MPVLDQHANASFNLHVLGQCKTNANPICILLYMAIDDKHALGPTPTLPLKHGMQGTGMVAA